ncbi:MAG: hypothetical protein Q4F11_00915 [Eubacteriales bacterium]|nr:hypothetical protein [Eubacteriales bacterium]
MMIYNIDNNTCLERIPVFFLTDYTDKEVTVMISSVYSYYMSQYGHKVNTKHDSHTKNQLKNTYSKVLKLNSQSPTYKIDISEAAQKYAIDLKENARELSNIAMELSDSYDGSITYKKTATSSNENAVEVTYLKNSTDKEAEGFEINVSQLAARQTNTGNFLQPNSTLITPGTYSFDLSINNLTYEFEFNVSENESTNDIQNKLSRLINRSNIGLHSEVITDSISNSAISITSDATGLPDAGQATIFDIRANSDSLNENNLNLIDTLGLNRIASYPSNAIFEINGQQRISPTNEFNIGKAYAITLKDITAESVQIGLSANADSVTESISELMSGYNNMVSITMNADNNRFAGNAKLQKDFMHIAKIHSQELSRSGILVDDNGQISIDSDTIKEMAESDSLNNVFKSLNSFKNAIQNKADHIAINPMNYVNNKIVAYKNPQRQLTDPYNLSAYTGMMFNSYM